MPETILKAWLSKLDIPVSATLLKQQLKSHPDYPSLLSITDTLDYFGITNTAVEVERDVLSEIDSPFLAHLKNKENAFVICDDGISPEKKYPDFFANWSGVIVMAEKPAGWKHRTNSEMLQKEKRYQRIQLLCICAAAAIAVAAAVAGSGWVLTSLLLLAAAGIFVSWMIVSKDLGIENKMADQVCGKENECTAVMQSEGAKLLLGAGLSDAGLLWFTALFISLCAAAFTGGITDMTRLVSILSVVSLPVIFYSLFYQWRVVKKWCRLCLITVSLLVIQLLAVLPGLLESGLRLPALNTVLLFAMILFGTGLFWFSIKSMLKEVKKLQEEAFNGLRFKQNESVVKALLEKQRYEHITPFDSDLQLGNRLAPVQVMVACNPYCGPCAHKHKLLHEILENNEEKIGLTVRFLVNTGDTENKITRALQHIFAHIRKHTSEMKDGPRALYARQVLNDWFSLMDMEKFAALYPAENCADVTGILRQQEEWCKTAGIKYTPTIFINGYELPHLYTVKDIPGILSAAQNMEQPARQEEFI